LFRSAKYGVLKWTTVPSAPALHAVRSSPASLHICRRHAQRIADLVGRKQSELEAIGFKIRRLVRTLPDLRNEQASGAAELSVLYAMAILAFWVEGIDSQKPPDHLVKTG
jgi:hypothetical protein